MKIFPTRQHRRGTSRNDSHNGHEWLSFSVKTWIDIDAPGDLVWDAFETTEDYHQYLTRVHHAETVGNKDKIGHKRRLARSVDPKVIPANLETVDISHHSNNNKRNNSYKNVFTTDWTCINLERRPDEKYWMARYYAEDLIGSSRSQREQQKRNQKNGNHRKPFGNASGSFTYSVLPVPDCNHNVVDDDGRRCRVLYEMHCMPRSIIVIFYRLFLPHQLRRACIDALNDDLCDVAMYCEAKYQKESHVSSYTTSDDLCISSEYA